MWLQICAYHAGLVMILLWAIAAGCSRGDGGTEQRGPGATADKRHRLDDVADMYRAGELEKARAMAIRFVDDELAGFDAMQTLELKLGVLLQVPSTAEFVAQQERDLMKSREEPMDESSAKAVAALIDKVERAATHASKLTANVTLNDRERHALLLMDESRANAIKSWILMNPRNTRETIYRAHQKFLESRGIKAASLVEATDTPPRSTDDDRLLQRARADTENIRKAVDAFYQALFTADPTAVRATMSKTTTDEQIRKLLAVSEQQKKELGDEKVVSVDLGKARVEAIAAHNGQVTVRVSDITITREKGGRVSLINKVEVFAAANEDERWVLCLK